MPAVFTSQEKEVRDWLLYEGWIESSIKRAKRPLSYLVGGKLYQVVVAPKDADAARASIREMREDSGMPVRPRRASNLRITKPNVRRTQMPKLEASLADISTDYEPIKPGLKRFELRGIHTEEEGGKTLCKEFRSRCLEEGDDFHKPVKDRVYFYTKDGDLNRRALARYKAYMEAIIGADNVAARGGGDDIEEDELIGGIFNAQVEIGHFTPKDGPEDRKVPINRFKAVVPLD